MFSQRSETSVWALRRRVAAAVVLGLGVSGLHYLAMQAVHFHATGATMAHAGLETGAIATLLVGASAVMLVILLAGAQLDQRRAATAQDLAAVATVMREIGRSDDARASIGRAVCELTGAAMGGLLEPDGRGNLVLSAAHGLEDAITISLAERSASGTAFRLARAAVRRPTSRPARRSRRSPAATASRRRCMSPSCSTTGPSASSSWPGRAASSASRTARSASRGCWRPRRRS